MNFHYTDKKTSFLFQDNFQRDRDTPLFIIDQKRQHNYDEQQLQRIKKWSLNAIQDKDNQFKVDINFENQSDESKIQTISAVYQLTTGVLGIIVSTLFQNILFNLRVGLQELSFLVLVKLQQEHSFRLILFGISSEPKTEYFQILNETSRQLLIPKIRFIIEKVYNQAEKYFRYSHYYSSADLTHTSKIKKLKDLFYHKPANKIIFFSFYSIFIQQSQTGFLDATQKFIGIVRIVRVFRVVRIYQLFQEGDDESWSVKQYREIKRKAFIILSLLILTLFITAGILHSLTGMNIGFSIGDGQLSFDQALYYVTVTCSSVGYGDIVPNNDFSRIFILFLIITIIFIATKTTSDFNALVQGTSEYQLPFPGHKQQHVILIGQITTESILRFSKEFYHPDNNNGRINCDTPLLIMNNEDPSEELITLMRSPFFYEKLYYLQANPMRTIDLNLAKIENNTVIILTDQFSKEFDQKDVESICVTQLIKEKFPQSRVFTQIKQPNNMIWAHWYGYDSIISINLLQMSNETNIR